MFFFKINIVERVFRIIACSCNKLQGTWCYLPSAGELLIRQDGGAPVPISSGDPHLIEQIVNQIKSQGTFDQWRRDCLSDVDTKPAYQNLTVRVDNAVASFLSKSIGVLT